MSDEYVKDVTETHGLCKSCDDWLFHLINSKSGRKDLEEAHQKILEQKRKNRSWRKKP